MLRSRSGESAREVEILVALATHGLEGLLEQDRGASQALRLQLRVGKALALLRHGLVAKGQALVAPRVERVGQNGST